MNEGTTTAVSGVAYVRKRSEQFVRNGKFDPRDMCGTLTTQAFLLGADQVEARCFGNWWVVTSNYNWLTNNALLRNDPNTPFLDIVGDERLGRNSCYSEIILAAFCSHVFVFAQNTLLVRIGDESTLPEGLLPLSDRELSYFFRFDP